MKVVINRSFGGFSLSEEAYKYMGLEGDGYGYLTHTKLDPAEGCRSLYKRDASRTNPLLVECVETLGNKASGRFASLKVVEIPDDVDWYINNSKGIEVIVEKHRMWS